MLLRLCREFKKLPSEVLAEDAELLQLIKLVDLGNPGEDEYGG